MFENTIVKLTRDLCDPKKNAERMVWEKKQADVVSVENFAKFLAALRLKSSRSSDCSCGAGGMASELAGIKINVCINCARRFDIPAGPYFEEQVYTLISRARVQGLLPSD